MSDLEPRVIVKIRREGLSIPYQDSAELMLTGLAADAWQQMAPAFPETRLSLNRILTAQTPEQLLDLLTQARNLSGEEPPDILSFMAIDSTGFVDREVLVQALQLLPFVEFAYQESQVTVAGIDPSDDPLAVFQLYLGAAPFGIEAFFALSLPGGDGAGVRFVDIEYSWLLNHEDLTGASIQPLTPLTPLPPNLFQPPFTPAMAQDHGTAVMGVVMAQDNSTGGIGIAPAATGGVASVFSSPTHPYDIPNALLSAVGFLRAGDILLLELQGLQSGFWVPVEVDPHIALMIRAATLLGIIVIECAGNGAPPPAPPQGADLDNVIRPDGTTFNRGAGTFFFDSGAIIVGAAGALSRSKLPISNFGTRVDCFSWGEAIVTTASQPNSLGQLYMIPNPLTAERGFGGTSGAGAIVAGAAVVLQGIARSRGTLLTPDRMRDLLSDRGFNTSSANPSSDRIGVMPNLKEASQHI